MKRTVVDPRLLQAGEEDDQNLPERAGVEIQKGRDRYEFVAVSRVRPAPKLCTVTGTVMHCLSTARRESVLTDLDTASACILRRTAGLPLMHRVWSHASGYLLGYTQRKSIGNPSQMYFLHPGGTVLRNRMLPDAATDVVESDGSWVMGCRNLWVYAVSVEGEEVWQWRMPPDQWGDWEGAGPYRLRLAATAAGIAVAYGERLWLLTSKGETIWEYILPKPDSPATPGAIATRAQAHAKLVSVFGREAGCARLAQLRFSAAAAGEDLLAVRMKIQQHDAVLEDDETGELSTATSEPSMQAYRPPQKITALGATRYGVIAGTAQGELHVFDSTATLQQRFCVGKAKVSSLVDQGGLNATSSAGLVTLFQGDAISGFVELADKPVSLAAYGSAVLAWREQTGWLVNRHGQVLWRAEFARRIREVICDATGFHVLAGPIYSFRPIPEARRSKPLPWSEQRTAELLCPGEGAISRVAKQVIQEDTTMKKTFRIDPNDGVTVYGSRAEAEAAGISGSELFETEEQLATLVGNWAGARLVDFWNGLPGVRPVTRFTKRKIGVQRIWRAVQALQASPAACDSPKRKANGAGRPKAGAQEANAGSKRERMIHMLRQPSGATLQALRQATGWQAHSIRGFISGNLTKRMGLKIESFKRDGERVYALHS